MDYPDVGVQELTDDNVSELLEKHQPSGVKLGSASLNQQVNGLIEATRARGGQRFLLSWKGGKIPRGANILGHTVAWTQNGQVITEGRQNIGTYDRLIECGGEERNEQLMLVFLFPDITEVAAESTKVQLNSGQMPHTDFR